MIRRLTDWVKGLLPRRAEEEAWKPVVGYEGIYEVSSLGRIRSLSSNRKNARQRIVPLVMLPLTAGDDYRVITLCRPGVKRRRAYIHILILEAFRGPRPDGTLAAFLDGDHAHFELGNLVWATPAMLHAIRDQNGMVLRGERHGCAKLVPDQVRQIRALVAQGEPRSSVAKSFGVSDSSVNQIVTRNTWKHLD